MGLTAAAVNESAQHCDDLFALRRFLREPSWFARNMGSYEAGGVVNFGVRLASTDESAISRLFLVPDADTVGDGMAAAGDPEAEIAVVEEGHARLVAMVRETAQLCARCKPIGEQLGRAASDSSDWTKHPAISSRFLTLIKH